MSDIIYDPRSKFYTVAAFLWLCGFVFALMPLEAYEAESFLLAVLCSFFAAVCVLAVAPVQFLRNCLRSPVCKIALGFWALALISALLSEIPFVSFIYFCFFSLFPLGFFTMIVQGRVDTVFFKILGRGMAGLLAVLAVFCLIQYFFLPDMLSRGLVHQPLANPNSLAGLLSLGFFASFGWMLAAPSRLQSNLALILAVLIVAAIFTTGSRGAVLALIAANALFMVFVPAHIGRHKRCTALLLLMSILSFVAISLLAPESSKPPSEIVNQAFAGEHALLWTRPAIWAASLEILKDHIWTGTGIGTFFLYYPEVRGAGDPGTAGLMAHSDPLQFAVEMGVLAPLLFYMFIVIACVRTWRALQRLKPDDVQRIFILAPFCGLAAMVIHAHITFHFHVLSILMVGGLLIGFWFIQSGTEAGKYQGAQESAHENAVLRWLVALPIFALIGVLTSFQASELLINKAQRDIAHGQIEQAANAINRAGKLSSGQNARALVAASNVSLSVLQLNAPFMPDQELQAMYEKTESLLDRAESANPRLVQIPYHRAELESFAAPFLPVRPAESKTVEAYLHDALNLDPRHLASRMKLANLALRKGQQREALEILKPGLEWRYKNQNPRFFLEKTARLAEELRDQDVFDKVRAEWIRYFPQEDGP